jgi:hypothetical protein
MQKSRDRSQGNYGNRSKTGDCGVTLGKWLDAKTADFLRCSTKSAVQIFCTLGQKQRRLLSFYADRKAGTR